MNYLDAFATEIKPAQQSGGPNTSHTIVVAGLADLLDSVPPDGSESEYEFAALEDNVLGKATGASRRRTYRYLRELYLLRPDSILFRALRDLWPIDSSAQPLLAGLCALARDPVLRASSAAILESAPGDAIASSDLADAVREHFPDSYSASTLAKIGRNTASSWEQTGHLIKAGHTGKERSRPECGPANVAYALLIGHLQGARGQSLFETLWAQILDRPRSHLIDLAVSAGQQGMIEYRNAGGVIEIGFGELMRPFTTEGQTSLL